MKQFRVTLLVIATLSLLIGVSRATSGDNQEAEAKVEEVKESTMHTELKNPNHLPRNSIEWVQMLVYHQKVTPSMEYFERMARVSREYTITADNPGGEWALPTDSWMQITIPDGFAWQGLVTPDGNGLTIQSENGAMHHLMAYQKNGSIKGTVFLFRAHYRGQRLRMQIKARS